MAGGLLGSGQINAGLLGGLLAQVQPRQIAPRPAPMPQRDRVSGWRVLDRVLGGQTITGGLDAERARLEAEATRPQAQARQARIQSFVDTLSPEMQLAFASNPEKLGEAFASRAEGRVLDQGDVYMSGETPGYAAPFEAAPGSAVFDPRNPTAPIAMAPQENKVAGGALVAPDGRVLYRGPAVEGVAATADAFVTPEIAQGVGGGAPRIERQARPETVTVADGAEVYDPQSGSMIARNAPDRPSAAYRTPATVEIEGRLASIRTDVTPTIARMEQLLSSGDVITGLGAPQRLLAAKARAAMGDAEARRRVAATEEFVNTSGRLRVGMAKTLGANPSNADIQLLERVTAGDINQSADGLLATIRQGRELSARQERELARQLATYGQVGSSGGAAPGRPRARNPQTGAVVEWNGSAWVPA